MTKLTQILDDIFDPDSIKIAKYDDYWNIEFNKMYEYVNTSFSNLLKVSELFGTERIDSDDWLTRRCDTCDYGSSYVKELQIYDVTKNEDLLKESIGEFEL